MHLKQHPLVAGERTELGDGECAHYERLQVLPDHSLEGHMSRIGDITSRVEEEAVLSYLFLRAMCE